MFLDSVISSLDAMPVDDAGWDAVALEAVAAQKSAGRFVPGLGHPVHKQGDPRTPVLIALASEHGQYGPHLALFEAIGRVHADVLGRTLPLNGAGVCGAVLADIDIPLGVIRGVALLARCAGLLGHIAKSNATRSRWTCTRPSTATRTTAQRTRRKRLVSRARWLGPT